MKNKELLSKIASLETLNDQLSTEIQYLDTIARELGFAEGLKTLKEAALEMIEEKKQKKVKED